MNRRLWWIGAAGAFASVCLSASVLFARQGVVRTKEGRVLEGDIEEKPDQVIINIHGIRTSIARENVQGQVEYFDNIQARYQDRLAKLPKNPTAEDHLNLARWLFDVKQYDLAQQEIDKARKIDPNSAEAATLEQTVISQRRMEKNRQGANGGGTSTTPRPPANAGNTATGGKAPTGPAEKPRYLTADDINRIRQMEWRENDNVAPRVTVPYDVRKRYADMKAIPIAQFSSLTAPQQAYTILGDPDAPDDMREKIRITSDPQSLMDYRRIVQPLIINNCAVAGCHGARGAGDFMLYANNPEREDVAYTNFYILQTYTKNNGEYLMIDRTYPDRSLLSQYALNPDSAEIDHPPLKGQTYKGLAANSQAPSYQTLINWMKELRAGDPKYGIKYDLPGGAKKKDEAGAKKPGAATPEKQPPAAQPQAQPQQKPKTPPPAAKPPTAAPRPQQPPVNANK